VPAGGSAAAAAVALSAALLQKVATLSLEHWQGAAKVRGLASALRRSAEELIAADALAYTSFVVARRGAPGLGAEAQRVLESARAQIVNVPLDTARTAAETVEQASALAHFGNPNLRSDASIAALLAAAATDASVVTMAANLPAGSRDRRLLEARRLARAARRTVAALRN
jgi:glutamate formiminotransferase/formiminotetrahydrofolate cyclodeaminase